MITYYLVRHGLKESIPFDPPLTQVGIKQAQVTAQYLKNISFHKIFTSPKLRTRQTAEIIGKSHSLPVHIEDRLIERLEWEIDKTFDEYIAEWNITDIDRSYQPSNGMSSAANGERMKNFLDELSHTYKEGNILMVTHGGTIGDVLRSLFTEEVIEHKTDLPTGARYIDICECSITTIRINDGKYELVRIGDISHLSIPLI